MVVLDILVVVPFREVERLFCAGSLLIVFCALTFWFCLVWALFVDVFVVAFDLILL